MTTTISMDFVRDWEEHLVSRMTARGVDLSDADPDPPVDHLYFELERRWVPPVPRKVKKATGLQCPPNHADGLRLLEEKLRSGDCVHAHLSKAVVSAAKSRFDQMRNDFGLHHFHLGTQLEPNSTWIARTNDLLFAVVKEETVYFVDIKPHGAWAQRNLIAIIASNWPELLDHLALSHTKAVKEQYSEAELLQARKAGVTVVHQTPDGKVVMPLGGGITTAGTSLAASMRACDWRRLFHRLQQEVEMELDRLKEAADARDATQARMRIDGKRVYLVFDKSRELGIVTLSHAVQ